MQPDDILPLRTLDDFATACIATFHNGFYEPVLRAGTPSAQLAAIVASPWSSGHYGGSLQSFYLPLEEAMNINEKRAWVLISFVAAPGRTPASAAIGTGGPTRSLTTAPTSMPS